MSLGVCHWGVMPQGPVNAPSELQRAVNEIRFTLIQAAKVILFVDDGSLKSGKYKGKPPTDLDWREHLDFLDEFSAVSVEAGPMLKFEKGEWLKRRLEALGLVVGHGVIQPTQSRIAAILAVERPVTAQQMMRIWAWPA